MSTAAPCHQLHGHQLCLLQNGEQFFPRLCQQIAAAQHSILLESYIYAADSTGSRISQALINAARRGVLVRLLLDGFGSADLPDAWQQQWQAAGIQLLWFRRGRFSLSHHRLRRLHRKLVVIDSQIGFIGGINIVDDIPVNSGLQAPRLDYAVEISGPLVTQIESSMTRLWRMVLLTSLKHQIKPARLPIRKIELQLPSLQLVLRDNLRHRHQIERMYLRAFANARREIILANPYFLPGKRFRRALIKAACRGVNVKLLLQGQVEYRLQHYATQALYPELQQHGILIYEYQASFLHAKVAVIDQHWATVGSSNIDPFSLLLAREANLMVQHHPFARQLRSSLLHAIEHQSQAISPSQQQTQHWLNKLTNRFSYGCIRLLLGLLGRAQDW